MNRLSAMLNLPAVADFAFHDNQTSPHIPVVNGMLPVPKGTVATKTGVLFGGRIIEFPERFVHVTESALAGHEQVFPESTKVVIVSRRSSRRSEDILLQR
jgi:hypothetical protein